MPPVIPIFQYPATIVCVDDDKLLLQALQCHLSPDKSQTFSNAMVALTHFEKYESPTKNVKFLYGDVDNELYDYILRAPVNFDVTKVQNIRNITNRSSEISVVICDYSMPDMNGIELCGKLDNLSSVKKILLTGAADEFIAIDAFNSKKIDKYIRKDSLSISESLRRHIKNLTREYFVDKTKHIISHLEVENLLPLTDELFVAFFDDWCDKNNITEFYLIDKLGSFLVIDKNNNEKVLLVHSDDSLSAFCKSIDDIPDVLKYLDDIKNFKRIPFFGIGKESWQFDISEWNDHFYEPTTLKGRDNYYWVVIDLDGVIA